MLERYRQTMDVDVLHSWAKDAQCKMDEMQKALEVAALALEIASDWTVNDVQCDPPQEWNLRANYEDAEDGWCSTLALAQKLRELAELGENDE